MRHVATICFHQVRRIVFDTGTVAWLIGVPLALIGVLGSSLQFFMSSGFVPVEPYRIVIAEDGGDVAAAVAQSLHDMSQYFGVVTAETRDAARAMVARREADAAIVFSATNAPTLSVISAPDAIVTEMLMPIVREVSLHVQAGRAKTVAHALATGETVPSIHVVHEVPQTGAGGRALSNVRATFGIYLVFAFSALFGRGVALHNEYKDGTLQRIVAGGVAYGEVVAGHVLTIFLIGAVQAAVVLTVTGFLGTLWLTAGWGVLVVTLLGTVFVASGLAICLSGLVRSTMLIGWLTGGVPTLLAMTGGAFFPLEAAPLALQKVARINPVYWVMELFEEGYVYEGVAGQLWPLSVLLLIGMLGAVIGIQGLRRVEL